MTNTENFYATLQAYFKAVDEIDAEYQAELDRYSKFQGSTGGKELTDKAKAKRTAALQAEKDYTRSRMKPVFDAMRARAKARTLTPPTAEQQAIIAALRSRKTLTKQELEAAENSLSGCPLALAQLDELARDHGFAKMRTRPTAMPTEDVLHRIDQLEANFNHTLRGDGGARFNRLPKDASYALVTWGDFGWNVVEDSIGGQRTVPPKTVDRFIEAVNE